MGKLPLEGIRVADITVVWAGTFGTKFLADWGAEVIRVEPLKHFQTNTRGLWVARPSKQDLLRIRNYEVATPDWEPGRRFWNRTPVFNQHGRNKLSMTLDLRLPEGKDIFYRLIAISDLFMENNVPTVLDHLGIDTDELLRINPGLIIVRMPAYGLSGPYRNYRAMGVHTEAVIGHHALRGDPDTDYTMRGQSLAMDSYIGEMAAFAALSGLWYRERTGKGQLIELVQTEGFLTFMGQAIMDYTMNGRIQDTLGNRHPAMAPHDCYPCRGEDRWITIAVRSDEEFQTLCELMRQAELAQDPRFVDAFARLNHQDELDVIISQWTQERDTWELFSLLQQHGIPAGPVMNEADAYADPHLKERGFFQPLTQAETGTHLYPGLLWQMDNTPNKLRTPPCLLGEHNEYVYKELLGVSDEEYAKLEEAGHIGMEYAPDIP